MGILDPKPPTRAELTATYAPASGSANYASTAALAAKADVMAIRVGTRRRPKSAPVKYMFHAAGAGHGWAHITDMSNVASSNLNDTSDYLMGSQATKITTNGTGQFVGWDYTRPAGAVDVSDCDLRLWLKFDAPTANLGNIQIIVGDATLTWRSTITAFSANSTTSYTNWPLQSGRWNILDIPQGSNKWVATGTPNWSALQRVIVKVSDKAGAPIDVRQQGVAFTKRDHTGSYPNGVLTWWGDDSYGSQDAMRAIFDLYGWKMAFAPTIDRLGLPGKLTLAQLKNAYFNGHEVVGHAFTDANHAIGLPAMASADQRTELENVKSWMDTNAFPSQAYAYPLGNHDAVSEANVATYFDMGRLAFMQLETPQAVAMPFAIQALNAGTQSASFNTFIDKTVAGRGWLNVVLHDKVSSGATGNNITDATFNSMVSYAAASGIAVRTPSEVLATLNQG